MKKIFFLIFLLTACSHLFSADEQLLYDGISFNAGLRGSYATTPIVFSESETDTSLNSLFLALEVDFDITHFLTIGVIAGYNWSRFDEAMDITQLPLTLQMGKSSNQSMIFGLNLKSELFSSGDISVSARGEFVYFKLFKQESEILLPVVSGLATVKNWFFQASFDLFLKYHGIDALVLFLGPQLNLTDGTLTVSESIEDLTGEVDLKYHQKNLFGLVGGATYDFGRNWSVGLEFTLFSQYSITAGVFYQF